MFKYKDSAQTYGPVQQAALRGGRFLRINARGAGIGFTLDETLQEGLSVVFRSGERRYCTFFGGQVKRNEPGAFLATKAPAPGACPPGS